MGAVLDARSVARRASLLACTGSPVLIFSDLRSRTRVPRSRGHARRRREGAAQRGGPTGAPTPCGRPAAWPSVSGGRSTPRRPAETAAPRRTSACSITRCHVIAIPGDVRGQSQPTQTVRIECRSLRHGLAMTQKRVHVHGQLDVQAVLDLSGRSSEERYVRREHWRANVDERGYREVDADAQLVALAAADPAAIDHGTVPGHQTTHFGPRWALKDRGGPLGHQCVADIEQVGPASAVRSHLEEAASPDEFTDVLQAASNIDAVENAAEGIYGVQVDVVGQHPSMLRQRCQLLRASAAARGAGV